MTAPPLPEITLRPAVPADAVLLEAWRREPSARQFQPLQDLTLAQLRADIAGQRMAQLFRGEGEKFQWVILVSGRPAGWLTLVIGHWEHGLAEIGYTLSTPYLGQGLMFRALDLLLADLFARTVLVRIEARCAIENVASFRVLERLGFQREGRMRSYFRLGDRRHDNYLYALLREDYLKGRSP